MAALMSLAMAMILNMGTAIGQVAADTAKISKASTESSMSVSVQPFFLLNNAGKLDLELQHPGKKSGYVFTAEVYSGKLRDVKDLLGNSDIDSWDKIAGAGIGITKKYKFKDERSSPYVALGLTYRYLEISFESQGFYSYVEDGLTYYDYGLISNTTLINTGLVSGTFGYQKIADDFVYDFYFGFGYKAPLKDPDFKDVRRYDRNISHHAFKGAGMLVGFKLGYLIK